MAIIGIDFGSSYTTVAWYNPATGCPEAVCFNGDGSVKMPSTILYSNGGFIIGNQAQGYIEEVYKLPDEVKFEMLSNFIPSLKRILNPSAKEFLGESIFTHEQLLVEFFKHVFKQVKEHCGNEFTLSGVSFSYPVDFEESKIAIIRQALTALGLSVEKENLEPIAAVTGFLRNHTAGVDENILVFDFGGGTIDVACVQNKEQGAQLICEPKGSHACGGQDIDRLLYDDLQKKVLAKTGIDISAGGMIDYTIMNSCRRIKELFSGENEVYEIAIPLISNGRFQTFNYLLNREAFENIIYPKVHEAVSIARQVQKAAESNGYQVGKILLIGGSSKLTLVSKLLGEIFPQATIETCGEKDIAVALGNLLRSGAPEAEAPKEAGKKADEPAVDPDVKIDRNRSITCKSCGSENCFKLTEEPGYICLACGWKGKNVTVKF